MGRISNATGTSSAISNDDSVAVPTMLVVLKMRDAECRIIISYYDLKLVIIVGIQSYLTGHRYKNLKIMIEKRSFWEKKKNEQKRNVFGITDYWKV